jgi:glycosyltransferase involved in cell wall biosynthesis
VVPSFNNAANNRHINNMNSIIMQEYSNYHVVFIDDASTDSTYNDINLLLARQQKLPSSQYTIIRNT